MAGVGKQACLLPPILASHAPSKPQTQDRETAITGELTDVLEDIRQLESRTHLTGVRPTKQEKARYDPPGPPASPPFSSLKPFLNVRPRACI